MPIIYRYIHVPRKDGTLRHAPFIPVIVRNKFEQVMKVVGLVDSGADTTVVPRDLADLLGMKENAASTETGGIGGKVKVKRSRLRFMLEGNRERYSLDVPALILQDNDNDVPLLLGRHGFFEHFHITFKQDEQKVVLKRINPKEIY
ncbi:MAG TPA: aspartyl protease family protein [Candidatus Nanoarchaeia archaeon]|nr:aspartyl protease family protein [Candidatus Nanoarchaeia archaeon]